MFYTMPFLTKLYTSSFAENFDRHYYGPTNLRILQERNIFSLSGLHLGII